MYVVAAHGLIIALFLLWGLACPRQEVSWRDTWTNLLTGALLAGGRALVVTAAMLLGSGGASSAQHSGLLWLIRDLTCAFVLSDLARYWLHRLHHEVPALWRFHQVHHASTYLDASSGLRMHVADFVQLSLLPVLLFRGVVDASGFHPLVWPLLVLLTDLVDAYQHANLGAASLPPRLLAWHTIINNPITHSWHHSNDPRAFNRNYGQALLIWDRLFGTWLAASAPAPEVGLPRAEALEPTVLGLQLLRLADPRGSALSTRAQDI